VFDPFACANSIEDSLLGYMASSLPIGNHPSQIRLGAEFYAEWSRGLFRGPFVEALPKYELSASLADRSGASAGENRRRGTFWRLMSRAADISWKEVDRKHPAFLRARDERLWSNCPEERNAEEEETSVHRLWNQRLYWHQWEALRKVCDGHKSVVVATSTGSGKTECYLLPLLYLLTSERPAERSAPGVRAIILFPMNALVEDQMRRLRKLLFWINLASVTEPSSSPARLERWITFGRYTGDTPVGESDSERKPPEDRIEELGELATRAQMRRTPPDILVTNFSMLEYALLRSEDQELFKNARAFKMLVLDEVHTYSGTVGAEVAMLLRRLRAYFRERAGGAPPTPTFVGTSATIGSGARAVEEMSAFASELFGVEFRPDQIVLGKIANAKINSGSPRPAQPRELMVGLSGFLRRRPFLLRLIAGRVSVDDEPGWESRVADDLEELALLLDACPEGLEAEIRNADLLSSDPEARCRQLLGRIAQESPAIGSLIDLIQTSEGACTPLEELALEYFQVGGGDDQSRRSAREALSLLLALVANATVDGRALYPARFHHFVSEQREGLLCINQDCPARRETDGWWSRLFLQHARNCPSCSALVYPLLVCRKCGFVYLEAWRRGNSVSPEKDDLEAPAFRILFRPTSGLAHPAEGLGARTRAVCLSCGHWFESRETPTGRDAQNLHRAQCGGCNIIEILEWSEDGASYEMSECALCEQHWYADQEAITEPTISPFAAASVFLEELATSAVAAHRAPKIISFSDTRQQAAKLAAKLQKSNRDYVFRQLLYQLLATAQRPPNTVELFRELYTEVRRDDRRRQLFIDVPAALHDDLILEQALADLIFREVSSAYHTLEALGLVRIDYSPQLLRAAEQMAIPVSWGRCIPRGARENLLKLVLDWGFRFRRCAYPAAEKLPVRPAVLQRWKIYIKSVAGPGFGQKSQNEAVLFLERADRRNPLFDFMCRLSERNGGGRHDNPPDRGDFNDLMQSIWGAIFSDRNLLTTGRPGSEAMRDLIATRPAESALSALQLNLNPLVWSPTQASDSIFRCDVCGRLAHYSLSGVCPVKRCQGNLRAISQSDVERQFSPARHYRRLISRERELRPLRVEEHTAQIANLRRLEIERLFRSDTEEAVDVISGSTTFELGVDLGTISSVFLANLPPRVSNYRQRAGRAGRREGMIPFVLGYVRQRPHDQYFWRDLKGFISGPIPTPKFKLASEEVLKRHGFSVLLSFALKEYQKQGRPSSGQWGPLWKHLFLFLFLFLFLDASQNRADIERRARDPKGDIAKALGAIYDGIEEPLRSKLSPSAICEAFYGRIKKMQTVLSTRGEEGCIKVLGDYGILPTYAFPIYVDELRLNEVLPDKPPRSDLKLTRDRRISLVEYHPGRTIVAGKSHIQSKGIWEGFDAKDFSRCPECRELFFGTPVHDLCGHCGARCDRLNAVIPWGGYFGSVIPETAPPEVDYEETSSTEVVFDPASDPPEFRQFRPAGPHLSAATVDANVMQSPRMRQFSPRPGSPKALLLETRADITDVAAPYTPVSCLALPDAQPSGTAQPYYLLHEFSTDILRLRIARTQQGKEILSSPRLAGVRDDSSLSPRKRTWYFENFWLTLGEAILVASARLLDIDQVANAELGITFRTERAEPCLQDREIILFDTAPGGAGYSREIAANLKDLFLTAAGILDGCGCGDSCYRCLRSYRNQWIHSRLDRHLVADGLRKFISLNWPPSK
jgi:DEAD/DEAH box helicase/MrfA Zn-binding domain/Helicase conserved C-terminal domain